VSVVQLVTVTRLSARGTFALEAPILARVVTSTVTQTPSLLVSLYVELRREDEPVITTDPTTGLVTVQYAVRPADLRRRSFKVDGLGTPELSVRELRRF